MDCSVTDLDNLEQLLIWVSVLWDQFCPDARGEFKHVIILDEY